MSLLSDAMETCVMLNKLSVDDGYGGERIVYTDGSSFQAAFDFNTSMQARVAESQGVTNLFTVTTRKSKTLEYHDVFRRVSDGKIFRVTSDGQDKKTPDSATLNMRQVTAEEWSLPNGQSTGT